MRAAKNRFQHDVWAELADGADSQRRHRFQGRSQEGDLGIAGDFGGVEEDQFVDVVGGEGGSVEVRAGFEKDA